MFANCYKGRRVFITGHTGFKGSWLAAWLSQMGATVCGFADCVPTSPSHFEAMHLEQHVQDMRGDIRDRDAVVRAMKEFRPDVVFHLAAQALVADGVDVIVAVATPTAATMLAAVEDTDIPVVYSAVTDPVSAGFDGEEGITGTSDALNTEAIMNLITAINPDIDTIGLLYDLSQDASTQAIADAKAFCDSKGIKYIEKNGTTTAEVQMAAEALVAAGVKAVFTPTDNTVMTAELSIYETFLEAGIQHFTGADSFALNGAFVGYGVDYVQLGEATADMVVELLCGGKTPADLPYQTFDNGIVTINTESCEALGLDLDTVKEVFKPYCTEIVVVTTQENF